MLYYFSMGLFNRSSNQILQDEMELLKRATPQTEGTKPPSRSNATKTITADQAQTLSIITRGIQIHQTAAKQCSIYGFDNTKNKRVTKNDLPIEITKPVLKYSFDEYLARTISTLFRHGNAYRLIQYDANGKFLSLKPLDPNNVIIETREDDPTEITGYIYNTTKYLPHQISHLKYIEIDEMPLGLSPIKAANIELRGIYDTRNYTRRWLQENTIPLEGYLQSAFDIDADTAKDLKDRWAQATKGTEGIAVLGQSTEFKPLYLKPEELQWVEVQKFDAIQQVRMTTAPASLMLISLEGNSQVYANIEQDWIGYARFGLMTYLLPIEEELTFIANLLGLNIDIKFNVDALLRSDTLTRYQAHAIATGNKPFLTQEEVRDIEDRDNTPEILSKLEGGTNGATATPNI